MPAVLPSVTLSGNPVAVFPSAILGPGTHTSAPVAIPDDANSITITCDNYLGWPQSGLSSFLIQLSYDGGLNWPDIFGHLEGVPGQVPNLINFFFSFSGFRSGVGRQARVVVAVAAGLSSTIQGAAV